jgi:drug/metabolite transporter (DMT)-like permease
MTIDRQTWLLLILLSILWGGAFFFIGVAVRELPPFTIVLVRVALGALFLLPALKLLGGALPKTISGWTPFLGMGLLNNVIPFSLLVAGQTYVSSGLASVLNATTPLFTVLVMAAFGDEPLTARRVGGVLLGLIGVVVLRALWLDQAHGQTIGMLLCLAAALSYGFSGWWARRTLTGVAPITSSVCQLICSSAVMAIIAAVYDRPWQLPMPSMPTVLSLVALAALGTSLAYIVFFQIINRSGPSNVMLVTLLIPVTAILLGFLVLGEPISTHEIAGALIIASALLVIDGRAFGWLRRRALAGA